LENLELVTRVCRILDERLGGRPREQLMLFVADRPGHDRRYAVDSAKIQSELSWRSTFSLDEGLRRTINWYLNNNAWLESCTSGAYREYYAAMYGDRLREVR
jgi:dTDP-glucose 4,6-dehydratase